MSDSIPRWRTEDERYEAAIEAHERTIVELRDRVRELEGENRDRDGLVAVLLLRPTREAYAQLEAENERLRRPLHYMQPQVISFFGFHMESADIDG